MMEKHEKVFANGYDPVTRKLITEPINYEEFGKSIIDFVTLHSREFVKTSVLTNNLTTFRFNQEVIANFATRVTKSVNLDDPLAAGWTFLISSKDKKMSELMEIIKPLTRHRGMQDNELPLIFNNEPPEDWFDWIQDNYYSKILAGKKTPYYILIIGDPALIPFKFQSFLDSVACVGRLDLPYEELNTYIDKILRFEKKSPVSRHVLLMGTNDGENNPTYYSTNYLVKPLSTYIEKELKHNTTIILNKESNKTNFINVLDKSKPAITFTASHGAALFNQSILTQKQFNGGICFPSISEQDSLDNTLYTFLDVPDKDFIPGSVFFQFACYGYGTPSSSDFSHWNPATSNFTVKEAFVASLPKKLLAHPNGPIGYIGHVDAAWLHGFIKPQEADLIFPWSNRISPFLQSFNSLLRGEPIGRSLEDLNKRYDINNSIITNLIDQLQKGKIEITSSFYDKIADLFITRTDAQNYMIFGDPATRINLH